MLLGPLGIDSSFVAGRDHYCHTQSALNLLLQSTLQNLKEDKRKKKKLTSLTMPLKNLLLALNLPLQLALLYVVDSPALLEWVPVKDAFEACRIGVGEGGIVGVGHAVVFEGAAEDVVSVLFVVFLVVACVVDGALALVGAGAGDRSVGAGGGGGVGD